MHDFRHFLAHVGSQFCTCYTPWRYCSICNAMKLRRDPMPRLKGFIREKKCLCKGTTAGCLCWGTGRAHSRLEQLVGQGLACGELVCAPAARRSRQSPVLCSPSLLQAAIAEGHGCPGRSQVWDTKPLRQWGSTRGAWKTGVRGSWGVRLGWKPCGVDRAAGWAQPQPQPQPQESSLLAPSRDLTTPRCRGLDGRAGCSQMSAAGSGPEGSYVRSQLPRVPLLLQHGMLAERSPRAWDMGLLPPLGSLSRSATSSGSRGHSLWPFQGCRQLVARSHTCPSHPQRRRFSRHLVCFGPDPDSHALPTPGCNAGVSETRLSPADVSAGT